MPDKGVPFRFLLLKLTDKKIAKESIGYGSNVWRNICTGPNGAQRNLSIRKNARPAERPRHRLRCRSLSSPRHLPFASAILPQSADRILIDAWEGDERPLPDAGAPARRHQGRGQDRLPRPRAARPPRPPRRLLRCRRARRRCPTLPPGFRRLPNPLRRSTPRRLRPPPPLLLILLRSDLLLRLGLLVVVGFVRIWVRVRPRGGFLATASFGQRWLPGGVSRLGIRAEGGHPTRIPHQCGVRLVSVISRHGNSSSPQLLSIARLIVEMPAI
jgi:hypothetical protein